MLERSFEKDEKTIKKQIAEIADYPYPGWVSININKKNDLIFLIFTTC